MPITPTNHVIPVSNGLLAHRARIGAAIWAFLWFIDRVTAERPSQRRPSEFEGLVLGGAPISTRQIAEELQESLRTTQRHIDKLCSEGYIETVERRAGEAFSYVVRKSKKWIKTREVILPDTPDKNVMGSRQKCQGGTTEVSPPPDKNGVAIRKDNTGTIQGQDRASDDRAIDVARFFLTEFQLSGKSLLDSVEQACAQRMQILQCSAQTAIEGIVSEYRSYLDSEPQFRKSPRNWLAECNSDLNRRKATQPPSEPLSEMERKWCADLQVKAELPSSEIRKVLQWAVPIARAEREKGASLDDIRAILNLEAGADHVVN